MFGVWQADEGQVVFSPIFYERIFIFRANDENHSVFVLKFLVVLAQLRHMPTAERSDKAAVENQQHGLLTTEIGQSNLLAAKVGQFEIRGGGVE